MSHFSEEQLKIIEDNEGPLKEALIKYLTPRIGQVTYVSLMGKNDIIKPLVTTMQQKVKNFQLKHTLNHLDGIKILSDYAVMYLPPGSSVSNSAAASSVGYGGNSSAPSYVSAANVGGETILPASVGNSSAVGENMGETILARVGNGNTLGLEGGRRRLHRKSKKSKKSRKGRKATRRRSA
jgi:hypothetical protein